MASFADWSSNERGEDWILVPGNHDPVQGEKLKIAQRIALEAFDADDQAIERDAQVAFRGRLNQGCGR